MNVISLALVVVLVLASLGVAAWSWLVLTDASATLGELDYEGMRSDIN